MGVLPLQFPDGESAQSLGLTGEEVFSIDGLAEAMRPRRPRRAAEVAVRAERAGAGRGGLRATARGTAGGGGRRRDGARRERCRSAPACASTLRARRSTSATGASFQYVLRALLLDE